MKGLLSPSASNTALDGFFRQYHQRWHAPFPSDEYREALARRYFKIALGKYEDYFAELGLRRECWKLITRDPRGYKIKFLKENPAHPDIEETWGKIEAAAWLAAFYGASIESSGDSRRLLVAHFMNQFHAFVFETGVVPEALWVADKIQKDSARKRGKNKSGKYTEIRRLVTLLLSKRHQSAKLGKLPWVLKKLEDEDYIKDLVAGRFSGLSIEIQDVDRENERVLFRVKGKESSLKFKSLEAIITRANKRTR